MVRPEKVKVVFIGLSQQGNDNYNHRKEILKSEVRLDWAPSGRHPANRRRGPPRATRKRKIVIGSCFPPEADPQMAAMGMPPTANAQPIVRPRAATLADGGQVLFLPRRPSTIR